MDSALHLGSDSSYSASQDDGVFFEGPSESDSSSTGSSHFDEREYNVTEGEKPSVEMIVDLQVFLLHWHEQFAVVFVCFCG